MKTYHVIFTAAARMTDITKIGVLVLVTLSGKLHHFSGEDHNSNNY